MHSIIPLFPGLPGGPELLIVLFVLVLLFGANKIPKLARSTGQAMGEFKRGREEIEDELDEMKGDAVPGEDSRSAAGAETRTDTQADTRPETRTDTQADTRPETETETTTRTDEETK